MKFTQDNWLDCIKLAATKVHPAWPTTIDAGREAYMLGVQAGLTAARDVVENEQLVEILGDETYKAYNDALHHALQAIQNLRGQYANN